MVARPLPWTAVDVLAVVVKHWIAGFAQSLPRRVKDDVKAALEVAGRRAAATAVPPADVYRCRRPMRARHPDYCLTRRPLLYPSGWSWRRRWRSSPSCAIRAVVVLCASALSAFGPAFDRVYSE